MKMRRMETPDELAQFRAAYSEATGFDVTPEVLARYRVFAGFEDDEMMCGFWLIDAPPYRAFEFAPDNYADSDPFCQELLERDDVVEMGGVWKSPRARSLGSRLGLTARAQWEALRSVPNGGYMLFFYDHSVPYLRELYSRVKTRVIYRGPMTIRTPDGAVTHKHASVECLQKSEAVMAGLRFGAFFATRSMRKGTRQLTTNITAMPRSLWTSWAPPFMRRDRDDEAAEEQPTD